MHKDYFKRQKLYNSSFFALYAFYGVDRIKKEITRLTAQKQHIQPKNKDFSRYYRELLSYYLQKVNLPYVFTSKAEHILTKEYAFHLNYCTYCLFWGFWKKAEKK